MVRHTIVCLLLTSACGGSVSGPADGGSAPSSDNTTPTPQTPAPSAPVAGDPTTPPPPDPADLYSLPAERNIDWSQAGRPDGIPNYPVGKTACNSGCDFTTHGDDSTDDSAIIQSCVDATAPGQACLVRAGTYAIKNEISLGSRQVLRGEGQGKTLLRNRWNGGITVSVSGWSTDTFRSLSSGYTKGSTSLTLQSAPTFPVNTYIAISEDADSFVNPVGLDGDCAWCGGTYTTIQSGQIKLMGQIVKVTQISGNTITIDRPLYFTFLSSLAPAIMTFNSYMEDSGVESLTIQEMGTTDQENVGLVHLEACSGCWVKNVEMSGAIAHFVELRFSKGNVVRDSYFHDPRAATGGLGYGVHVFSWGSDDLIENNIFVKCRHSVAWEGGGSGVVVGYNYMYRDWLSDSDPNWLGDDLIFHGAHPYMNLMEGNIHQQYNADDVWGSASHSVYFRNNATATGDYSTTATENISSVSMGPDQTTMSLVGNIFGTATRQGQVELDPSASGSVLSCGNSYVGGTAADSACSSLALPASMYLSTTPTWFTTPFGSVPWPAIGPDVSASVNKIPAQLCYEHTVLKGTPFDSSACYAQ